MRDWVDHSHDDFDPFDGLDADNGTPANDADGAHAIPEDVIDAFFDETADAEMSRNFDALMKDKDRLHDVFTTRRAIDELRRPVHAPDQTRAILDRVDTHRGWMRPRSRRRVTIGRYAAAGLLLGLVAGAFVSQRVAPDAFNVIDRPAVVGDLVQSSSEVKANAATTFGDLGQVFGLIPADVTVETDVNGADLHAIVLSLEADTPSMCRSTQVVLQLNGCISDEDCHELRSGSLNMDELLAITGSSSGGYQSPWTCGTVTQTTPDAPAQVWTGLIDAESDDQDDILDSIRK